MILVDSPIWIDHLREGNAQLASLLNAENVYCHPLIVGELAMGSLRNRTEFLKRLDRLKTVPSASLSETRVLIESEKLFSRGIGLIDAMLLASCLLDRRARLWTYDRRLSACANGLGIAYQPLH